MKLLQELHAKQINQSSEFMSGVKWRAMIQIFSKKSIMRQSLLF